MPAEVAKLFHRLLDEEIIGPSASRGLGLKSHSSGHQDADAIRRRADAMMRITIVVLALLLAACNDEGSPAAPAANVSFWKIAYSPNMPASMSGGEGDSYFDFPSQNGVHYAYAPAIKIGQTITMRFAHHWQCKLRSNGRHCNRACAAVSLTEGRYPYGTGAV
jgi:hypothetical protein